MIKKLSGEDKLAYARTVFSSFSNVIKRPRFKAQVVSEETSTFPKLIFIHSNSTFVLRVYPRFFGAKVVVSVEDSNFRYVYNYWGTNTHKCLRKEALTMMHKIQKKDIYDIMCR